MSAVNQIPSGSKLQEQWQTSMPTNLPTLTSSWTASALLSPFGDSIAPIKNSSQLYVATIESRSSPSESWMRVKLFLTRDLLYFEFIFSNVEEAGGLTRSEWYWIDSSPNTEAKRVYGPFRTTLQIPDADYFKNKGAKWGNRYPLMCTDTNLGGIECDHWIVPTPGTSDHGSWFAFRRDNGSLFRIFTMDSSNPQMIPILGSFFIVNFESFTPNTGEQFNELINAVKSGRLTTEAEYWNPLLTQEDIGRAVAFPLASASCTRDDIQSVIPGFSVGSSDVALPRWTDKTYIEGWTIGTDFIPYYTRVCYMWTSDKTSKQQTVFVGLGADAGKGSYSMRTDTCLNTNQTDQPYFEWNESKKEWALKKCLDSIPGVGLPFPDWLARDRAMVLGQVVGNPNFGLKHDQTLSLVAAELPRGGGELAIFWVWFLGDGTGMLFSEGNFMNPTSHNLQLIDYNVFIRNAEISPADFSNPCEKVEKEAFETVSNVRGHLTRVG